MEWWLLLSLFFCAVVILFLLQVPVAFAFACINIIGFYIFMGGGGGLGQLILSIYDSVTTFALVPVPLFVLMGEVMFHSGVATNMISALDKWLGGIPGRLSLLAVAGGTIFATLSGSSMANVALLGSVLVPEMKKRGYTAPMSVGPILGSGGLAIMIPPSVLGVTLAAMGRFSVGDFLIAIIIPGLVMASCKGGYIVIRCWLQPHLAPPYELGRQSSLTERVLSTLYYVVPLGSIVFLAVGLIFFGVATPSEAAALGAFGCFALAFVYKGLSREIVRKSVTETVRISTMLLMIFTGSAGFSQLLAFTGASQGLVELALRVPVSHLLIIILMLIILLVLGCFMESMTIIMITIPIFMPIVRALGLNPLWFGVMMLITIEMGATTPPFGMLLYIMKGVVPELGMATIIISGFPFLACDLVVLALIISFPALALWLPGLMH